MHIFKCGVVSFLLIELSNRRSHNNLKDPSRFFTASRLDIMRGVSFENSNIPAFRYLSIIV